MVNLKGVVWNNYKGVLTPDVPPHVDLQLSQKDIKTLLKASKCFLVLWPSEFDTIESGEYWYVISDSFKSLDELSSKRRYDIKKGLKNCLVKKMDGEYVAKHGYEVYYNAYKRYKGAKAPISKEEYYNDRIKLSEDKRRDFWGVFDKETNNLIGISQNIIDRNSCSYVDMKFDPDFLRLYPSYALIYEMNRYYLNEKKLRYVNDGARCINHETNMQDFLVSKLGFRKAYCKLNINYRSNFKSIISVIYPFRSIISNLDLKIANKVTLMLKLEEIRRSFV